jgi:hypothetical protein
MGIPLHLVGLCQWFLVIVTEFFGFCVATKEARFAFVRSWYIILGTKAPQFWLNVTVQ